MTKFSKKTNLKDPIDPDKLDVEKIDPGKELYAVDFPLDSTPDYIWEKCFEREYKIAVLNLQRRITVFGDNLRLVAPLDEVNKNMIAGIKKLVNATNRCVEEYNKKMKQKKETQEARRKRDEEAVEKWRESLKEK